MTANGSNGGKWGTKEKILLACGLVLIFGEWINAEILARGAFHYEFLIGGLAMCGIAITQWGDKR